MEIHWEEGAAISLDGDAIILSANREGMLSLAGQLADLAGAPAGSHIHLDAFSGLEDGSTELILDRIG